MCLGMNPDQVPDGVHCASTSNRNFEGRQGKGARTHLVSPAMAAAAAIHGKFVDVRRWLFKWQQSNLLQHIKVKSSHFSMTILIQTKLFLKFI